MLKTKGLFLANILFFIAIGSTVVYSESEIKPSFVVKEVTVNPTKIIISFNRRPGFFNQELKYKDSAVVIPRTKNMFQLALPLKIPNYISVRRIAGVEKMFFIYWHQFGEESDEVILLKSWEGNKATFLIKRDSVNISRTGAESNNRLGTFIVDQHYLFAEQD